LDQLGVFDVMIREEFAIFLSTLSGRKRPGNELFVIRRYQKHRRSAVTNGSGERGNSERGGPESGDVNVHQRGKVEIRSSHAAILQPFDIPATCQRLSRDSSGAETSRQERGKTDGRKPTKNKACPCFLQFTSRQPSRYIPALKPG
jgi:hypothetical protein